MHTEKTGTLQDSYLIQRLLAPHKKEGLLSALGDAFSFGGGYKNGGLTQEGFDLIKSIMRFDYMGAAEYEFGALPAFFKELVTGIKDYGTWEIKINKIPI